MGIITKAAKAFNEINWDKVGIFTGGVLFGTAGIKILSSKDAKKVYTQTAAAAMRAQSCVSLIFLRIFRLPNVIRVPREKASVLSAKKSIDSNTFSYSALRLLNTEPLCSHVLDT